MSREELPKALATWYDYTKWVLDRVDGFPKNQRFVLGTRLADAVLEVMETLAEAAYSRCRQGTTARQGQSQDRIGSLSGAAMADVTRSVRAWVAHAERAQSWRLRAAVLRRQPIDRAPGPKTSENRAIRGGNWNNTENNLRSSNRNNNDPTNENNNIGFRVARPMSALPVPPGGAMRQKLPVRTNAFLRRPHSETAQPCHGVNTPPRVTQGGRSANGH